MSGIFPKFQPRYAEQNVITFPVSPDKKPAIKNWQKVGLDGSAKLAEKSLRWTPLGCHLAHVPTSPFWTWGTIGITAGHALVDDLRCTKLQPQHLPL